MSQSSTMHNLYVGRAGQAVVMSEFLIRGYNVAAPEVDRGDDLFIVRDDDGDLSRIQVKTANAKVQNHGYSASFAARYDRLQVPSKPDVAFVFVVRHLDRWSDCIVLPRHKLFDLHETSKVGKKNGSGKQVTFYFKFDAAGVTCDGVNLTQYRNDWSSWPPIQH